MGAVGYRVPVNETTQDTFKFLTWEQFPVLLDKSIKYFAALPQIGTYQHLNPAVKDFKEQLLENVDRQFTLSGIGSLIDYDRYGQNIKRPSPQLGLSGCAGNSLCLEPTCFGFTEGVQENNQIMQSLCWSLQFPCLKDSYYSDRMFMKKMMAYFGMFFEQPVAVVQAYQRTRLLKEAVKIVCTDENIRFTGPLVGGADGLSLPFWIHPTDPQSFPNIDDLPSGVGVGGVNLQAFMHFLANRLFSGSFGGGMHNFKMYGLEQDYQVAKQQTASVVQDYAQLEILARLAGEKFGQDYISSIMGDRFRPDGLFPTFKLDDDDFFTPITQEILEPATIAGYAQNTNPEHGMAGYRGLLLVPDNWRFNIVEPPKDNFSDLGLGAGLNFRMNTPGVFPIMSSSLYTGRSVGPDGKVIIGETMGEDGLIQQVVRGTEPRERAIQEALRTELFMTYSAVECTAASGQLPNVGRPMSPQAVADGFALKSTIWMGTDVQGPAKPVLLLFKTDTPRSARPIVVCSSTDIAVTDVGQPSIASCCPGDQTYAILTFSADGGQEVDMTDYFTEDDTAVYRTGAKGMSFLVDVTAVSGAVVSIEASGEGVTLPCCSGSPDDYGTRAELISLEDVDNDTSEIFKAKYDSGSTSLMVELLVPISDYLINAPMDLTLEDGTVIHLKAAAASTTATVFVQLVAEAGETCVISTLDCNCLDRAVLTVLP